MTATGAAFARSLPRAWERTSQLLWRPVDARKWAVLAFAQFLAALPPKFWGGGAGNPGGDWKGTGEKIESVWEKLAVGGMVLALVAVAVMVLTAIGVALLWVGSRGQFVFLEDVMQGTARIVEPWKTFRREGNSLFWCRLALFLVACVLIVIAIVTVVSSIGLGALLRGQPGKITALVFLAFGSLALLAVPLAYAAFFLNAFVVPIMHRYRLGALDAWRRFLAIFGRHPFPFLIVGLATVAAFAAFLVSAVVFGLMTCCLGFLLLILPYVSNVLLLPVTAFYRSFTVEFLAQFDPHLLPTDEVPAPLPASLT